jgi:hypothetical protein
MHHSISPSTSPDAEGSVAPIPQGRPNAAQTPGGFLAESRVFADVLGPGAALAARAGASASGVPCFPQDAARLLDGPGLMPPGVTDVLRWQRRRARPAPPALLVAGAGHIPLTRHRETPLPPPDDRCPGPGPTRR